jgi:hypothetical protein
MYSEGENMEFEPCGRVSLKVSPSHTTNTVLVARHANHYTTEAEGIV